MFKSNIKKSTNFLHWHIFISCKHEYLIQLKITTFSRLVKMYEVNLCPQNSSRWN